MLERETETILHTITEQTIGSAHSLALKDALATAMPKSIAVYLHNEVAYRVQEDLRSAGSKLPFSSPVVRRLSQAYARELSPEYILAREEYIMLLENAVHFVENYLCRPRWTLEQFVFEKKDRVTFNELQRKFASVCEYAYFPKLVLAFMRQKGWQEIGADDFRSLIARIDDRVVAQHTAAELARLTRPIFEFLLLQPEIRNKPIPIRSLIVFFEDKKMIAVMEYIEKICHIRSTDQLTMEQLTTIMEDLRPTPRAVVHPEGEPGISTEPAGEKPSEIAIGPEPVVIAPEAPLEEEEPPRDRPPAGDRRNVALSLTYSGMTESGRTSSSSPPLRDLTKDIAAEQRYRFIQTIFQKDESYYNVVIETLNSIKTWRDASLYLHTFYKTTGIDPELPEAIEFSGTIQLRYPPQHKS